jgi:hypothetical protein
MYNQQSIKRCKMYYAFSDTLCFSERISGFNIYSGVIPLICWYVQWIVWLDIKICGYEFRWVSGAHFCAPSTVHPWRNCCGLQTAESSQDRSCAVLILSDLFALSKLDLRLLMVSDVDLHNTASTASFCPLTHFLMLFILFCVCIACGAERYRWK